MEQRAELTAATRARIVEAVRDLILEVGSDAVTLPAAAARADVAPRTLYNHFPSRAALLSAALQDLALRIRAESEAMGELDRDDPRLALRRFIDRVYHVYEQQAPWFAAILGVRGDPELDARVAELRRGGRRRAETLLRPAADAGMLRVPLESAAALISTQALFSVWQHLVDDLGYSTPLTVDLVTGFLDSALFEC
jgi:AcrR family transcriptional regulator